jgi:hypothetical protein
LRLSLTVPQTDQRRDRIVEGFCLGEHTLAGRRRGRLPRSDRQLQLVAQLDDQPLRRLATDAGNPHQLRDVLVAQRARQRRRCEPREHRQRDLGADAAHRDEQLEETSLFQLGEAEGWSASSRTT